MLLSFSNTEIFVYPFCDRWRAVERPKAPPPTMMTESDLETPMIESHKMLSEFLHGCPLYQLYNPAL